jgi:DNA gyrase subunit B
MDVYSHHDGTCSEIHFQKGFATSELIVRDLAKKEKPHGTTICWKPDMEVFTDIRIPAAYFEAMLKKQAVGFVFVRADDSFRQNR